MTLSPTSGVGSQSTTPLVVTTAPWFAFTPRDGVQEKSLEAIVKRSGTANADHRTREYYADQVFPRLGNSLPELGVCRVERAPTHVPSGAALKPTVTQGGLSLIRMMAVTRCCVQEAPGGTAVVLLQTARTTWSGA